MPWLALAVGAFAIVVDTMLAHLGGARGKSLAISAVAGVAVWSAAAVGITPQFVSFAAEHAGVVWAVLLASIAIMIARAPRSGVLDVVTGLALGRKHGLQHRIDVARGFRLGVSCRDRHVHAGRLKQHGAVRLTSGGFLLGRILDRRARLLLAACHPATTRLAPCRGAARAAGHCGGAVGDRGQRRSNQGRAVCGCYEPRPR